MIYELNYSGQLLLNMGIRVYGMEGIERSTGTEFNGKFISLKTEYYDSLVKQYSTNIKVRNLFYIERVYQGYFGVSPIISLKIDAIKYLFDKTGSFKGLHNLRKEDITTDHWFNFNCGEYTSYLVFPVFIFENKFHNIKIGNIIDIDKSNFINRIGHYIESEYLALHTIWMDEIEKHLQEIHLID